MQFWLCRGMYSFWYRIRQRLTCKGRLCLELQLAAISKVQLPTASLVNGSWSRRSSFEVPSPPKVFWLVICQWRKLKLRPLLVFLMYRHLLQSPIWHACRLISKLLQMLRWERLQVIFALCDEPLLEMTRKKRALCLSMRFLMEYPVKESRVDVSRTSFICT